MPASFDQARDIGELRGPAAAPAHAETTAATQSATSSAGAAPGARARRRVFRAPLRTASHGYECLCSMMLLSLVGSWNQPGSRRLDGYGRPVCDRQCRSFVSTSARISFLFVVGNIPATMARPRTR